MIQPGAEEPSKGECAGCFPAKGAASAFTHSGRAAMSARVTGKSVCPPRNAWRPNASRLSGGRLSPPVTQRRHYLRSTRQPHNTRRSRAGPLQALVRQRPSAADRWAAARIALAMLYVGSALAALAVWAHRLVTFLTVEVWQRLPRRLSAFPTTQCLDHVNTFPAGTTGSRSWHDVSPFTSPRHLRKSRVLTPSRSAAA